MNKLTPQMSQYQRTLDQIVQATGDGKPQRDDPRALNIKMKPNQVYAVIAQDDDRYYRTVTIKQNDFTNGFSLLVSNPVFGSVPDGLQVIAQHSVFKQMREMNAFQSLDAFPFRGRDGR
jgi:hypothetical protein